MRAGTRLASVALTIWVAAAILIYFRQFAGPAWLFLARVMGHR